MNHYMPVLKAKAGEFQALENLSEDAKSSLLPVLEVVDIAWDYEKEEPAKTLDAHISALPGKISSSWGVDQEVLLDLPDSLYEETMADGTHPLEYLVTQSREEDVKIGTVTSLDRPEAYQTAVANSLTDEPVLALRISQEDLARADLSDAVSSLLTDLNAQASQVHLILDFHSISAEQKNTVFLALKQAVELVPLMDEWKTVTMTASAFPQNLSRMTKNSVSTVERTEWAVWQMVNDAKEGFSREISFGDYAISHPDIEEVDPRMMKMSANIRYTTDEGWVLFKGESVRSEKGFGQFVDLSKQLMSRSEYKGASFSFGDQKISECAAGKGGTGNATTWRMIGVNHHLELVAKQVSS